MKIRTTLIAFLLVFSGSIILGGRTAAQEKLEAPERVAPQLQQTLQALSSDDMVSVIVKLKEKADLRDIRDPERRKRLQKVIARLQQRSNLTQRRIRALLQRRIEQGEVASFQGYWIFNGLEVTATAAVIHELAALPEVEQIIPNELVKTPRLPVSNNPPEPNLALVNAPALWNLGQQGQGIVIANMDTGVDGTHPELAAKWRGGTNSWFDPYGQHPDSPVDIAGAGSGHGTWTMGVMIGGDIGGTSIGMAPAAQWIAVKIFNDQGAGTLAGIHAGFQWLLDPDGDPTTADAPHVVNNSWTFQTPGCNLEFAADLQALRTAGILPIFAAGNGGPNPETSFSPSNNPGAFAVGGVTNSDLLYGNSSRGPTSCGGVPTTFPHLVAPGVNIRSTDLYNTYTNATGTSLAAPHVSGALALLLSAFPNLTATQQETALRNGALDLGLPGPDNEFGDGRLDVFASYQSLIATAENQPPMVDAGADQSITLPAVAQLSGIVSDDGMPTPATLVTIWSMVSGPGTVTFADAQALQTTATFGTTGSYTLRLTATDGELTATDELVITVNPQPASANILYLSASANGTVGGVAYQDEDIIAYNPTSNRWSLVLDGSDVGLGKSDINAFDILADGTFLLSLDSTITLSGLGKVKDTDILHFTPTALGSITAGSFAFYLRGADVGLTTGDEDIDAIALLPDGRLLFSTLGNVSLPGVSGNDEDLIALDLTTRAATLYFDGSQVGLTKSSEDIWGVWVDNSGKLYLSTQGAFAVTGVSGTGADLFICDLLATGLNTTNCSFNTYWQGATYGLGKVIDGFAIHGDLPLFSPSVQGSAASDADDDHSNIDDDPLNGDVVAGEADAEEADAEAARKQMIFLPLINR